MKNTKYQLCTFQKPSYLYVRLLLWLMYGVKNFTSDFKAFFVTMFTVCWTEFIFRQERQVRPDSGPSILDALIIREKQVQIKIMPFLMWRLKSFSQPSRMSRTHFIPFLLRPRGWDHLLLVLSIAILLQCHHIKRKDGFSGYVIVHNKKTPGMEGETS
jgi:hypothetical protein